MDHSLTQFRKLYEEDIKTKDHSITQLHKQYEEEKKKNEQIRKICERLTMNKKEEE